MIFDISLILIAVEEYLARLKFRDFEESPFFKGNKFREVLKI